jgi:hypothetical protein
MRPPFQNPFQVVATTANFAVVCTPGDFDAESRARAIASTCEADLTRLEQIFGTTIRRGVASDYGVLVDVYAASAVTGAFGRTRAASSRSTARTRRSRSSHQTQ